MNVPANLLTCIPYELGQILTILLSVKTQKRNECVSSRRVFWRSANFCGFLGELTQSNKTQYRLKVAHNAQLKFVHGQKVPMQGERRECSVGAASAAGVTGAS